MPTESSLFRVQVSLEEVVVGSLWQQARTTVVAALNQGDAAVVLGASGTGKTLLLQDLVRTLGQEGRPTRLVGHADLLDPALKSHIIVIDDADLIEADDLATLGMREAPFVLAARSQFADRLADLPRPITAVHLRPLSPVEVAHFVAARLSSAGRSRDLLEPEAVLTLALRSRGVPRLVNVLAAAAVMQAKTEKAASVCRRHVEQAAAVCADIVADSEPEVLFQPAEEVGSASAAQVAGSASVLVLPRESLPAWQQPRGVLQASAIMLSLLVAVGWAMSERRGGQPLPTPLNPRSVAAGEASKVGADQESPMSSDRDVDPSSEGVGRELSGTPLEKLGSKTDFPGDGSTAAPKQSKPSTYHASAILRPRAVATEILATFRGVVVNETMHQSGQMSLVIHKRAPSGAVAARFEAWGGLLGSGELLGTLSEDGRLSASGQLMMGRNPFTCALSGVMRGGTVVGSATFVRGGGAHAARSVFTLTRS